MAADAKKVGLSKQKHLKCRIISRGWCYSSLYLDTRNRKTSRFGVYDRFFKMNSLHGFSYFMDYLQEWEG